MTGAVIVVLAVATVLSTAIAVQQWRRARLATTAAPMSPAPVGAEPLDTEPRLRASLDVLDGGVVVVAADGAVVHQNRAAAALADARGADVLVVTALEELLAEARAGASGERTLELFGPPARTMVLRSVPLVDNGERVVGAVGLVDDVTERERLDAVRRDFVANISHELRTPIGALGVLADAIADADDPDTAARLAGRMGDEVARVTRTIEDLLELSRIETRAEGAGDAVDLTNVIADALGRARPVADGAGIELVTVPSAERLVVRGDERQLVSAIFNLLDNAIKYSDPDSTVEIRSRRDGDDVSIEVSDQGIGIPAADLERVFERFYRVDAARRRTTGGTGLGLAIVRHVAINHGGDVSVRSRAGEGTTFTLRLPATPGAASAVS